MKCLTLPMLWSFSSKAQWCKVVVFQTIWSLFCWYSWDISHWVLSAEFPCGISFRTVSKISSSGAVQGALKSISLCILNLNNSIPNFFNTILFPIWYSYLVLLRLKEYLYSFNILNYMLPHCSCSSINSWATAPKMFLLLLNPRFPVELRRYILPKPNGNRLPQLRTSQS